MEGLFPNHTDFEQSAVLGWSGADAVNTFLVGYSNIEEPQARNSFVLRYDLNAGNAQHSSQIQGNLSSIGPMTMADYDNDGDLDLFVGGRSVPSRYPEPASSNLYRNTDGNFVLDSLNTRQFKEVGLVSGAVFSDIDSDGDADLILAIDWGPVTVFLNHNGHFSNATEKLGLNEYHGWWNGVTTGDFDEDGKPDIIATNWGLNNEYRDRYDEAHPLEIFYLDFDNNGTLDIVESYYETDIQSQVPARGLNLMRQAIPDVGRRIPTNSEYSRSSVYEIIGPKLSAARSLKANTLAHTIFLNRGGSFQAVEMPASRIRRPA